jgi:sugar-specific transcriptional regulator TrmB
VARQEAYRILAELQEKGLVEKIIAMPTEFKFIPIEDCLHILIERKKTEISETRKKATKLLQKLKEKNSKNILQEEESQFILVPEKEVRRRLRMAIENAQTSIDTVVTWNRLRIRMVDFDDTVKKALKRGVKFRFIIDKSEDENPLLEIREALTKDPLYKIKYSNHQLSAILGIYDEKEVIISISATAGIDEAPVLASNNLCLLVVAKNYFEAMWKTALEPNPNAH